MIYSQHREGEKMSVELSQKKNRIWELDFLKGIAFLMMVWDHAVYDMYGLFGMDVSSLGFFKEGIGKICAVIFMVVCGISVTLGKHNIKHGLITFSLGMALTAGTVIADMISDFGVSIMFGILHFLGLAMIIGHFAKKLPSWLIAILGVASYIIGRYFLSMTVSLPFLFPLGLTSYGFFSADYYPLFPNIAYVFFGIVIGKLIYKEKRSIFNSEISIFRPLNFLGRHTLVLYFAHQPVVVAVVFLILKLTGNY